MIASLSNKRHDGRYIVRFRELRGISQDELAKRTRIPVKKIAELENTAHIPDEMLVLIASAMDATLNDIRNFEEEKGIYVFSGAIRVTTRENSTNHVNIRPTFNYNRDAEDMKIFRSVLKLALTGELQIPNVVKEEFAQDKKDEAASKEITSKGSASKSASPKKKR